MRKEFRIIAAVIALSMILCASVAFAADSSTAKLTFSGITLEARSDGSVQGFLNFKIKNVESQGVGFTLEYNSDYVELSKAADNQTLALTDYRTAAFAELNQTDFAPGTFGVVASPSAQEGKYKKLNMNVYVDDAATGQNITTKMVQTVPDPNDPEDNGIEEVKVIYAPGQELLLGKISFKINNPADFVKLSDNDLTTVFRIASNTSGSSAFELSYVDLSSYPPVLFYNENSHLSYEFKVKNSISKIEVNNNDSQTNAAAIFIDGNKNDLVSYLNNFAKDITVTYADGTQIASTITWGGDDFAIDGTDFNTYAGWDPKGGVYNVSQKYNDETVQAKVTVTPVTVKSYRAAEKDYISYATRADAPATLDNMPFPEKAKPVFDAVVPGKTDCTVRINQPWTQTDPTGAGNDFFANGGDGTYTFSAEAAVVELPLWATPGTDDTVSVLRVIGAATAVPQLSAAVDDNGKLTITVLGVAGVSDLTGVDFVVRMPNGEILDKANFPGSGAGGMFAVTPNSPAAGQATIELQTEDFGYAQQALLNEFINMGNRLGEFSVAAKEPTKPRSDWGYVGFEPRNNYYIEDTYTFDYSGQRAQLFPFDDSMTAPSLTVTLPSSDDVSTTYDGANGKEPGSLKTVTVVGWNKTDGALTAGSKVTFEGILADTLYPNYGQVQNKTGNAKITLILTVAAAGDQEQLQPINNVVFNKKQKGYTDLQTAAVSLKNIGNIDIVGLTVSIDSDDFTIENNPPYLLAAGSDTPLQIKTKPGLAVGQHKAKITIGSNKTAKLAEFEVTFEVTDKPVYDLRLVVSDTNAGSATAPGGYAYAEGDTVTLVATPEQDYKFVGWEVTNGPSPVTFLPQVDATTATFVMPNFAGTPYNDITILAKFEETELAKLRLIDLQIFNPDGSQNDLRDTSTYNKVAFNSNVMEYNALAVNGADKQSAVIKIDTSKLAVPPATISAALWVGGNMQGLTLTPRASEPGVYDIEEFDLKLAPAENKLQIRLVLPGKGSKDYFVYIYRKLTTEGMVQFGYGNSPYGLIMQDTSATDKQAWKDKFNEKNCFVDKFTPNGGHKGLIYHPDAWGSGAGDNYDRNDAALFVYSGSNFVDPGIISLCDSLGKPVEDLGTVKRSLTFSKLTEAAGSAKNLTDDFRSIQTVTVDLGNHISANMSSSALAGIRVRPDIYFINYTFKDFDNSDITVQRPLIVLGARGDVNMDEAVNTTDAKLILSRYNERLPYENLQGYESGGRLYKYRMCDVNTDRNVNVGDRNAIVDSGSSLTEFYK